VFSTERQKVISAFEDSRIETVRRLREQINGSRPPCREACAVGCDVLDPLLPNGVVPRGGIIEWLGDMGSGATTLSLWMANKVCGEEGVLAIIDARQELYPPAIAAMGIDLERTVFIHPSSRRDHVWSLIQCLNCPSITVSWSYLDRVDAREYRCLQLAAESSGVLGVFSRPSDLQGQPSWANVRLLVKPKASEKNRRYCIEVVNCWQGIRRKLITVERDAFTGEIREWHESFPVRLAAQLAHPSVGRRAARA
jgi:protein ImuA